MSRYTSVQIPKPLANAIDREINEGGLGYSSRAEFVKDAIRRLIERTRAVETKEEAKDQVSENIESLATDEEEALV